MLVLKNGQRIENSRSLYYYVTNRETGAIVAKFDSVESCKEEIETLKNPDEWKVSCDWVTVKG